MTSEINVCYKIDANDRISFVDEGWCRFAEENNGPELMPPSILGKSLWSHIADITTVNLYKQIVSRVRQGACSRFTLRCDGPDCKRLLEMTIDADPDGSVTFHTRPVSVEDRESLALLAAGSPRSREILRACSWCARIDTGDGEWVEVEEATKRLRLFELESLPQLTHGICGSCYAEVKAKAATG